MSEKNIFRTDPPIPKPKEKEPDRKALLALEIAEKERSIQLAEGLPFLYGWNWYGWALKFYESTNKINLLCAANQISKSSTQIRKCINWATDQTLWPSLWVRKPVQFWYLYPTGKQVSAEFETKWKQFLPTGKYKEDPYYGWKEERKGGEIVAIHFNSGVHVYFKTYEQNAAALQSGTCDAIFCDEELPVIIFDELMFRLSASDGYFHMVFTATLGQDFWRRAMEPGEKEKEELPTALKLTVSAYDCMYYIDGTPSHWTLDKIKMVEARCSTHNEVLKRVYGKFIVLGGRKFEAFDIKRHLKKDHPIPPSWFVYIGADIGSGDVNGHPSALCYVAVAPDFRQGRVFLGWRGDGIATTAGDVVLKNLEIKKAKNIKPMQQFYDWANKDFFNLAVRANDPYEKAEKGHEIGEDIINTLFKHDMMFIYENEETIKLAGELAILKRDTPKKDAKDDFADAFRYAVTKIPWDWSVITTNYETREVDTEAELTPLQKEIRDRRAMFDEGNKDEAARIEQEFEDLNDQYG